MMTSTMRGNAKFKGNAESVTVDVRTLRDLLQEQASGILQSHRGQLDSVAKRLEGKQQEMFRTLRTRIDQASDKVDRLGAARTT